MPDLVIGETWRGRLDAIYRHRRDAVLILVVIVSVVAVSFTLKAKQAPARIAPPATIPTIAPSPSVAPLLVHVAGAVREPGLYELASGARVADAIHAAGGPARGADLDALNLAEPLSDGMKVLVPKRGDQVASISPPASPVQAGTTTVNINTADVGSLETIPGIGPVKAAAIVAYRDASGPFEAIEGLLDVTGIGPATLEAIRPFVTV